MTEWGRDTTIWPLHRIEMGGMSKRRASANSNENMLAWISIVIATIGVVVAIVGVAHGWNRG